MADTDKKEAEADSWPNVERRKGPSDRREPRGDRRSGNRVVTESKPRRQNPDRRQN